MKPLMLELMLSEAWFQQSLKGDSADSVIRSVYHSVAQRNGISDSTLFKSVRWYAQHPEWMNPVLNSLTDTLKELSLEKQK